MLHPQSTCETAMDPGKLTTHTKMEKNVSDPKFNSKARTPPWPTSLEEHHAFHSSILYAENTSAMD